MASDSQARNRTYLLCAVCKKTHWSLPVHLRRSCMKNSPGVAIERAVDAAKKEANELLRRGRVWEYGLIRKILDNPNPVDRMIKELQDRGNVVVNIPPEDPAPAIPAIQPAACSPRPTPTESESEAGSGSSGELYQCTTTVKKATSLRERMSKLGLYGKHSIDHPLLMSFAKYLQVDLANENFKQEVENVARFMYYMDPKQPNLLFVRQHEQTREYFNKLSEAGLCKQTVQNYVKSVKRFLKFHVGSTSLCFEDRVLHEDCKNYVLFLSNLQASASKQVSKEMTRKKFAILNEGGVPLTQCIAVLEASKQDFLVVMSKLTDTDYSLGHQLTQAELQLVLYYLEAVVILRHLQRPGVVEHMTVTEWVQRKRVPGHGGHVVVGVKEHKTSATQVATFALSQEEEMWFDLYFSKVRPIMLGKKRKHMEDEIDESEERFFISSTGNSIYNASNDLERLHRKYQVPKVTSQMARRAFETATKKMTDSEKSMVADYLTHSSATAEKHYRMREAENVVTASLLLKRLLGGSDSGEETGARTGSGCTKLDDQAAYDLLVKSYPVTVDGTAPKRSVRASLTGAYERYCYDRWRNEQLQLRVRHVLGHFGRRLPSEKRVRSWIEKQGWTANVPDAALVLRQWKPSGGADTALDSSVVKRLTRTQKWKGLVITIIDGKGRRVLASRQFACGEVVCDYHGRVVSRQEGLHIHQATASSESRHMFFYKDEAGQAKCVDAHGEECPCHPGRATFGRLINHSSKRANLRPRLYSVDGLDIILFLAVRDIKVNDELLFDYGVNRKSFAGEGLDLLWL